MNDISYQQCQIMITFINYLLGAKKAADEKNCKLKIQNSLTSGNPVKMKMTKQLCKRDDPSEAYLETLENRTSCHTGCELCLAARIL